MALISAVRVRLVIRVTRWTMGPLRIRPTMTTLLISITHVVSLCAKEQVIGIAARRIVATMEHEQAVRNRTVIQRPCDSMGELHLALVTGASVSIRGRHTVRRPLDAPKGHRLNATIEPRVNAHN